MHMPHGALSFRGAWWQLIGVVAFRYSKLEHKRSLSWCAASCRERSRVLVQIPPTCGGFSESSPEKNLGPIQAREQSLACGDTGKLLRSRRGGSWPVGKASAPGWTLGPHQRVMPDGGLRPPTTVFVLAHSLSWAWPYGNNETLFREWVDDSHNEYSIWYEVLWGCGMRGKTS